MLDSRFVDRLGFVEFSVCNSSADWFFLLLLVVVEHLRFFGVFLGGWG